MLKRQRGEGKRERGGGRAATVRLDRIRVVRFFCLFSFFLYFFSTSSKAEQATMTKRADGRGNQRSQAASSSMRPHCSTRRDHLDDSRWDTSIWHICQVCTRAGNTSPIALHFIFDPRRAASRSLYFFSLIKIFNKTLAHLGVCGCARFISRSRSGLFMPRGVFCMHFLFVQCDLTKSTFYQIYLDD